MSVSLRHGAVGLALAACVAGALVPAAHADNLEADELVNGTSSIGNVCRGTTSVDGLTFTLKRSGNANANAWANSSVVTVKPSATSRVVGGATLTLAQTSATTPSTWQGPTGINNGAEVSVPAAGVTLKVSPDAPTGPGSATVDYTGSGAAAGGGTLGRTAPVTFNWNVVDCTPADTTAPVITQQLTPATPDGANGWYRTDVAVDWTVSDAESAATSDGCADVTYTSDGTFTSTCSASSTGGSAGPASVTVKRDATPPTLEPVVTGDLGEDGWYVGDVTVSWTAADATSGIDTATACAPSVLAKDTAGEVFSCTVSDRAGNAASSSVTVKRDATDPVVVKKVSGTLGGNGWYTSNVGVSFDVSDATSSIASTTGCDDVTLDEDSSGTTYTCTATDDAGNDASATVVVKRDATAPDVTFTRTGAEGANGWFTGPVVLAWTVSDALSGVAATEGCVDRTVTEDGRHEFPCSVTDAAGNTATAEAAVDLDGTAPVITSTVAGPRKGTDWFTGDVDVSWSVGDPTSGVATTTGCDDVAVTTDTTGTTYTCSATDVAGNAASGDATVKRDATAPVLTLTGGPADGATYDFGDVPAASTCTASDATSDLVGPCSVTAGATTVGAGRTQVAAATDRAGNVATETRTYAVAAWRLDGFYKPVAMGTTVVNTVKAGSTVPLKFNVYKGGAAMAFGISATFTTTKVGCETGDVEDVVDFVTTGATALRYDSVAGQWVQNWATPGSARGACYRVAMKTGDGSSIVADFKLK